MAVQSLEIQNYPKYLNEGEMDECRHNHAHLYDRVTKAQKV